MTSGERYLVRKQISNLYREAKGDVGGFSLDKVRFRVVRKEVQS